MNSEYLLDAIGLLDDDLVQEAEEYRRPQPKRSYASWLGWAASFAVVIVLGYGLTHLPMGGGSNMSPACSAPAGSTPAAGNGASGGGELSGELSPPAQAGNPAPEDAELQAPGAEGAEGCPFDAAVEHFGMESGQVPAIMVDGIVYRYTWSVSVVRPDGLDIRDSTSYIDGEPEEDGQINFPKENVRYVMLEEGKVGVNWNGSYEWEVFEPDPPEEP